MSKISDKLGQILLPLITPYKPNGDVNYNFAGEMASFLIREGRCDSIIVTGTTGEFNTLSYDERVDLLKTVKAAVGGQVPIIMGSGCASTRETIALQQLV